MRQEVINIYKYEELSEKAKENARDEWRTKTDTRHIANEHHKSRCGFDKMFYLIRIWDRNYISDFIDNEDGNQYILEYGDPKDCPFTGCYIDEDIIEPIRNRYKELQAGATDQTDLCALREACRIAANKSYSDEIEYYLSDGHIAEYFECNDYEFLEDGSAY